MARSASFSPNGKQILTASGDGVARIWDARLQTVVRSLGCAGTDTLTSASFGPGGKSVVTASAGGVVTVWGASGTEPVVALRTGAESNLLDSVALTPDRHDGGDRKPLWSGNRLERHSAWTPGSSPGSRWT